MTISADSFCLSRHCDHRVKQASISTDQQKVILEHSVSQYHV